MAFKIEELPTELVAHILADLDCIDLLRCREVCRMFDAVVEDSAVLQYKIELLKAGQEDNHRLGILSAAERLQLLRKHQAAWASLDFSYQKSVPMLIGHTWELYGGVLAQGTDQSNLNFRQLPSALRSIEEKEWKIEGLGFEIRDFSMDPAQDLLVAIQMPDSPTSVFHVHLRNMYTGAPHPAAPNPAVLTHQPDGTQASYGIQISGDHIGIFVLSANEISNEVVIWNWKTGVCKLRHVLIGLAKRPLNQAELQALNIADEPQLLVVDYLAGTGDLVKLEDADFVCAFHYPVMVAHATQRLDGHHTRTSAPFYTARGDRLLAISFTVYSILEGHTQALLFVRTSTFLSHVDVLKSDTKRRFRWDEWGPNQTRMLRAPRTHSSVWVCYVFGMRFVTFRRRRGQPTCIKMYDFSRYPRDRRTAPEPDEGEDVLGLEDRWMDGETEMPEGIFEDKVTTSLPYHTRYMIPPRGDGEKDIQCVMLSEDTIITMCGVEDHGRNIRLMTF
ncbi:uncharacterized protein B0H18DRAFT_968898 [Fomitopsis serialis]|uniref:uncharacterized protein n=1 Tax=Fomitopsis serialis TaxID=139415 RepID=UPI0020082908|nr:uncharacterized protein B0H18DRAFT_968898 [Neoantrodia serialis]KAH9937048.1 hypothetical protein B0H18DRAFT_968898 [Neoantrodia serialis]